MRGTGPCESVGVARIPAEQPSSSGLNARCVGRDRAKALERRWFSKFGEGFCSSIFGFGNEFLPSRPWDVHQMFPGARRWQWFVPFAAARGPRLVQGIRAVREGRAVHWVDVAD